MFHRRKLLACKKRGACVGKTKRGKGTKWMVVADGAGVPLGVSVASATPAEITLIESAWEKVRVSKRRSRGALCQPKRLILDRAYDADWLRLRMRDRGIEVICPHRSRRRKPPLQDGRSLRRYKRRWIIERTIAWLGNFRRLLIRWERSPKMYLAFLHMACLIITARQL